MTTTEDARRRYALGLGSNRRHGRHGAPARVIAAALTMLAARGVTVEAVSRIHVTAPLGPSRRRFANAAAIVATPLAPPALLSLVKSIERGLGRRGGQRWGTRVIDIDLLLWRGGAWHARELSIPHRAVRIRRFVLDPLAEVAGGWPIRDRSGGTVRAASARLRRPVPRRRTSHLTRRAPAHRSSPA